MSDTTELADISQSAPKREEALKQPLKAKVVRGSLWSIARKFLVAPISLFLVPFTLHKLGIAGYGTWAVLATILNLSWLLDPGLSPTVTKYVAEHSGTDNIPEVRRVLDTSLALCIALATLASCILWFGAHIIIREFFRGPDALGVSQIMDFWPLMALGIGASFLTAPFTAFINGHQRMDLSNMLILSAELFGSLATFVFLVAGAGVRGLLLAYLLSSLFIFGGGILISRRLLPGLVPNPFRCKLATLRKVVVFSLPLYSGSVMSMIQGQMEKLYLARLTGIIPVGWYNAASEGAVKVRRVPDLLLGPVLAAASELDATKEKNKLEELHFRGHKYIALVSVPLVVFAVVAARTIVTAWLGRSMAIIAVPFALIAIGNFFSQISGPTYYIMAGRGILRPMVHVAILTGVLNIILSYIFIKLWGFSGAALGTVVPMVLSTLYFFIVCDTYFVASIWNTLRRAYLKPVLCSMAAAPLVLFVANLAVNIWARLALQVVLYAVVFLAGIAVSRFIDSFDIDNAVMHFPFMRFARRFV